MYFAADDLPADDLPADEAARDDLLLRSRAMASVGECRRRLASERWSTFVLAGGAEPIVNDTAR